MTKFILSKPLITQSSLKIKIIQQKERNKRHRSSKKKKEKKKKRNLIHRYILKKRKEKKRNPRKPVSPLFDKNLKIFPVCSWNFSKCRRIGIRNYKISLMSREQNASGVRDDDVARYLRGEKCADVVAKIRRKLARWQRLMISAGSLARFKSRPRLYPRVLPRICPSLFAASFTTPSHTGLSESHEPVNSSLALTNHVPHQYLIRFTYHLLNMLQLPHRENVQAKFFKIYRFL